MSELNDIIKTLGSHAAKVAARSYVPYSNKPVGVVILLEDGSMVAGVRVENASFSLTVSAMVNAVSTLYALGRKDIAAIVSSTSLTESDLTYTGTIPGFGWEMVSSRARVVAGAHIPDPEAFIDVIQDLDLDSARKGVQAAFEASKNAYIIESDFPVGCTIATQNGKVLSGVNVEHSDWSQIICAERNVLSMAVAYGLNEVRDIFVSCPKEPGATPCGACRQVIVELAPHATVWIDRGKLEPTSMKATDLLPGQFTGDSLKKPLSV